MDYKNVNFRADAWKKGSLVLSHVRGREKPVSISVELHVMGRNIALIHHVKLRYILLKFWLPFLSVCLHVYLVS